MAAIPDKYLDLMQQKKAFAELGDGDAGRHASGHPGLVRLCERESAGEYRQGPGQGAQS